MQTGIVGPRRVLAILGVATLVGAACATRPSQRQPSRELAAADTAVLQGCYDCLREARASYQQQASRARDGARLDLATRVFETDVLLVVRERELGLPASDALAEARRIAPGLPARVDAPGVLAVLAALPMTALAAAPSIGVEPSPDVAREGELRAHLASAAIRPAVRTYLQVAFDCEHPGPTTRDFVPAADAPTLVHYRVGICEPGRVDALGTVRAREPRFVEAALFIANAELVAGGGTTGAAAHLAEVTARFPTASAVAYVAASHAQAIGDDPAALAGFERTLALHPGHLWAMLGRVVALSHLARAREALDAATQLIAADSERAAEAYYWRAYNERALHLADDARRDIAAAVARSSTPSIRELSGELAYERGELDVARGELGEAVALDDARCDAAWYLALIARKRRAWPDAVHAFETAMTCYDQRAQATRARRQVIERRDDLAADYRARSLTALDASIASDTQQQHIAAVAGAGCALAGNDAATARRLLDLASDEPTLAAAVSELRTRLAATRR